MGYCPGWEIQWEVRQTLQWALMVVCLHLTTVLNSVVTHYDPWDVYCTAM